MNQPEQLKQGSQRNHGTDSGTSNSLEEPQHPKQGPQGRNEPLAYPPGPHMDAGLYDRYGAAIFAYARLHTTSREDAEDLTLEVFTTALERDNLAGLNDNEQLAWLRRVTHNKLIDSYRRVARHPMVALERVVELIEADEMHDPEHIALRQEEFKQLHTAIGDLSAAQRQILHLRYGAGLRFAEIAALLNKRETAVRKLLSRALMNLRTIYNDQQQ